LKANIVSFKKQINSLDSLISVNKRSPDFMNFTLPTSARVIDSWARLPGKTAGQDCRARLPGKKDCRARKTAGQERLLGKKDCQARKTARQDCRARLPGQTAVPDCQVSPNKSQNEHRQARLLGKTAGQDCREKLPGKTAGQDCRTRLPGQTAGQDCRARKTTGQDCWASLNKSQNKQKAPSRSIAASLDHCLTV
jgi:hypothetical protein